MRFGYVLTRILGAAALVCVAALGAAGTAAAQGGQAQQGQALVPFTLQPGATATLSFEGFCYQFGEPFPEAVQGPNGLAEGNIRAALALAQAQGLTGSDEQALEVQYAIWQLQGEADAPTGGQLTQDVLNRVRAAPAPNEPQGTSLLQALEAGQITVEVADFAPVGQPREIEPGVTSNFYGRGRLRIASQATQPLDLYMPVGTLITAVDPDDQDLVAYATGVQVEQAAAAQQATTAPAQSPYPAPTQAATSTTAPTQAPTSAPTTAPTAAATSAPTTAPTVGQNAPAGPQPTPRSYIEPVNQAQQPGALPNTSGGTTTLGVAIALGGLALAVGAARRALRRR